MSDAQVSAVKGYREFLRARMHMRREGQRGMLAELARAARVHPTMITHVFKGEAELSPEHALRVAAHLGLDEEETDRLINMVMLERAGTEEARRYFRSRIERQDSRRVDRAELFSDWLPGALSLAMDDQVGETIASLAEALHANEKAVGEALSSLERHGLARREKDEWIRVGRLQAVTNGEKELSRMAWRTLARSGRSGFSLCGPQSCSPDDILRLRFLIEEWRRGCARDGNGKIYAVAMDVVAI